MKGRHSEDIVCRYLISQNWKILERRRRTYFAEIDILAFDESGRLTIVEVKSVTSDDFSDILSKEQLHRLERAAESLRFSLELNGRIERVPALLCLAAVNQQGRVEVIFLDVGHRSMSK